MEKVNKHFAYRAILFFIAIVNIAATVTNAQNNIISSSVKSIRIDYWQITKDPAPKDTLAAIPDSLWKIVDAKIINENYYTGNWLIRTNIFIEDSVIKKTVWGMFPVYFVSAYEIYWDGKKIARNGKIGDDGKSEIAGKYNFNICLPQDIVSAGNHTIVIRISNYQNGSLWKWFYGDLILGPYEAQLKKILEQNYQAFFIIGILFIPFLFNLFLYFARKKKTEHLFV